MDLIIETAFPADDASAEFKSEVTGFLFEHLDQYGDAEKDIRKAVDYALGTKPEHGGFVAVAKAFGMIVGAVIINETHMGGYIPENILVYIAVDGKFRGKGIGKQLMEAVISKAKGDIALHVEPDNPAKKLYERVGFTNKYLEMRYSSAS